MNLPLLAQEKTRIHGNSKLAKQIKQIASEENAAAIINQIPAAATLVANHLAMNQALSNQAANGGSLSCNLVTGTSSKAQKNHGSKHSHTASHHDEVVSTSKASK